MAEDPFEHSQNTHPIDKKYRDAVAYSKKMSDERVHGIRSCMSGTEETPFNRIATKARVICLDCGADLNAGVVRASEDRECLCGTVLFTTRGEPTTKARIEGDDDGE